jgi:hypothetical protein
VQVVCALFADLCRRLDALLNDLDHPPETEKDEEAGSLTLGAAEADGEDKVGDDDYSIEEVEWAGDVKPEAKGEEVDEDLEEEDKEDRGRDVL